MTASLWESTEIMTSQTTHSSDAVIVNVTLGASPGNAEYPNRISLQMAGYHKLVGSDEADCIAKIQAYVRDAHRPLSQRSIVRDDRTVVT